MFGYDNIKSFITISIFRIIGLFNLIEYFSKRNIKFKIYINIKKDKFNQIIKNKNIQILYIIGHDKKTKFKLNRNEVIYYSEYKETKNKKEEIHLYHCTPGTRKSLIDYLLKKENKTDISKFYIKNDLFFSFLEGIKLKNRKIIFLKKD
ncbi:MAG: hypothetical protein VXZ40_02205 [Nanoarchaeota archaeon]|nr:hypothetical protein [Nanoarchaeota archaeon]